MKTNDEKLAQQIKSVFEDYDDGFGEQGWAELRKKYPEKESKKLPIWWLSGIAATLLLVIGLYFSNAFDTEKVILRAGTKKQTYQSPESVITDSDGSKPTANLATTQQKRDSFPPSRKGNSDQLEYGADKATQYIVQGNTPNTSLAKEGSLVAPNPNVTTTQPSSTTGNENTTVTLPKNNEGVIANATIEPKNEANEKPVKPKLSTEDFLKEQSKMLANNESKNIKNNTSKTTLDVFTGTFFNYHDDKEAKLSAGVGLNANVQVTKNLVFSFGAGISQNKVSFDNRVPVEVSQAMFASKDNGLVQNAPSSGAYSATAANDVSFNGKLLSIDLPMVVKFFPSKKQNFYISTGINSSSYITQKYTYNYSLSNFGYRNGEAQQQTETEESSLKGFDFANSAIIAIGINQNIGKNILIFEPYYKPALSTMGDKNLRISSAGLNLKFNFNGNSKK